MPTVLVSGAANGLGAAFLNAYELKGSNDVLAIDRAPIATQAANIKSFTVDIASKESINSFVQEINDRPLDLFIHSIGIRGLVPAVEDEKPDDVAACETMDVMDLETLMRTFQINAAGTFLLLRALLPNLQKAKDPKVVILSSRMGSIGHNELPNNATGSAYAYRASKAALNAIVRSFAVDVPDVTFVICHPGRVETKLVRCKEEGAISAEESVTGLLPLIEKWNKEDSGRYYDRFGEPIQW